MNLIKYLLQNIDVKYMENNKKYIGYGFIVFDTIFDNRVMKVNLKGQEYYWKFKSYSI